jgi:hypothetical protein
MGSTPYSTIKFNKIAAKYIGEWNVQVAKNWCRTD